MTTRTLKHDALGAIRLHDASVIERDTRAARFPVRWLARALASREAAALIVLAETPGVARLIAFDGVSLRRSYLPGAPLYAAPPSPAYFARALRLLRTVHRKGIAHNDLAKEANWLNTPGEQPALVDFQLAVRSKRRGPWFRLLAYEDLRHLLKHKRTYHPERLTRRQRAVLESPTVAARFWRAAWKPGYRWLTRRVLGWPERTGPIERQRP